MEPTRINVVIISEFYGGGVEKVNTILATHLDKKKFNVTLVSLVTDPLTIKDDFAFDFICVNVSSKKKSLIPLIRTLRKIRPQIILTSCLIETHYSYLYKRLYSNNTTVIYVQHSVWSQNLSSVKSIVINKYFTIVSGIFKKIDALVYVSNGVKTDFSKCVSSIDSVQKVIYNPITSGNETFSWKEINSQKISLVTAGRLESEKKQDDIIKALKIINGLGIDASLTIFGEGSRKEELKNIADEMGLGEKVIFGGYVSNLYEELKKYDIFILSSLYESFGNVLVEAMSACLPVISSDCPVGPKEILENGRYGKIVEMNSPVSIAYATKDIVENYTMLDAEGAFYRSQLFSIKNSVDSYERLFCQLLGRS